jgi:type I restriction-modification system DNA methylase subunit
MAQAMSVKSTDNSANLGFEAKLWLTADKLRNNMDAKEYQHVVLALIFESRYPKPSTSATPCPTHER